MANFNIANINNEDERLEEGKKKIRSIIEKVFNFDFNNSESYFMKIDDKNQFLKTLFKEYQQILNKVDDKIIMLSGEFSISPDIDKVIEFLFVKANLNYKEKIKIIKNICNLSLVDLILLEQKTIDYIRETSIEISEIEDSSSPDKENKYQYKESKRTYIYVALSTITILKCALHNYHRIEIVDFKNNELITKPRVNKQICSYYLYLYVFCKNDINIDIIINKIIEEDDFISIIKNIEKRDTYLKKYDRFKKIEYLILSNIIWYMQTYIIENDINKLLWGEKYIESIKNNQQIFYKNENLDKGKFKTVSLYREVYINRKILLPKNGVLILPEDDNIIESILLKEKLINNTNYITFITRFKNGIEVVNNIGLGEFLKLDFISKHYDFGQEEIYQYMYINDFYKLVDFRVKPKYEVISPVYWKYKDNNYIANNDVLNEKRNVVLKREFEIDIAPFLRKINGTPSQEAITLSKKLSIDLKDGYTIVKPHTRTYNKVSKI